MKNIIKKIFPFLPRYLDRLIRVSMTLIDYKYDFFNFLKYSGTLKNSSSILEYKIIVQYHAIEKGLSLKDRKSEFGYNNLKILIENLKQLEILDSNPLTNKIYLNGLNTAFKLVDYLPDNSKKIEYEKRYLVKRKKYKTKNYDAIKTFTSKYIQNKASLNYLDFVKSRKAIREFKNIRVDNDYIYRAINIARHTPSVCNRQAWKVINLPENKIIDALELHNGNRGFSKYLKTLLIVCVNSNAFEGASERNQGFIDGGLFSMNLMNAFHSIGLGTIPLNWSASSRRDKIFKNKIGVPSNFSIIMLLGVGFMPEEFKVPVSEKLKVDQILIHENSTHLFS